ncbi:MAG: hypothetical protein JNK58_00590 [Phycisphaerae bacterium]|nr:hypothetical protein [Phycisphaerae bacterium]
MTGNELRRMIAEGAIGLSLVAGAHFFVVEPMQQANAVARARKDAGFIAGTEADPVLQSQEFASIRERVGRVSKAVALTADELGMMERLNHSAESLGLQVQNMQKRLLPAIPPLADRNAESAAESLPPLKESRFGFTIEATGGYSEAVAFLHAIQQDFGLTSIDSLRIAPAGDDADARVSLRLTTTHWWFDDKPAKAAISAGERAFAGSEALR